MPMLEGPILVIMDIYPPQAKGGYQNACERAITALRDRGYHIVVLTSSFGLPGPRREANVWRELHFYTRAVAPGYRSVMGLVGAELHNQSVLRRTLAELKPRLAFIWSMWGVGMSLLHVIQESGTPSLCYVHDTWLEEGYAHDPWLCYWKHEPQQRSKRLLKRGLKAILVAAPLSRRLIIDPPNLSMKSVAFVSEYRKRRAIQAGWPVDQATVIYNGIDMSAYEKASCSTHSNQLRMLCAGRLVEEKGAHIVLAAMKQLAIDRPGLELTLSIAGQGGGEYKERLERESCLPELRGRVAFLGDVPPSDMAAVYGSHDMLLFPSTAQYEGLPLVLIEGMACGLPVIGSVAGGAAEILCDEENCLTFPQGDDVALAQCIARLATDVPLRKRLGNAGRQWVVAHCRQKDQIDALELAMLEAMEEGYRK